MTKNSINSNIPIEIAKGGTNAISMANTDGVCYFDGTRLVTTSVGVSGQVLTSNGAAVAPTFQVSPVLVVKKKLTSAQIKTIHTPLLLIAAHGANTLIVPQLTITYFYYGGSNVFQTGGSANVQLVYETSKISALSASCLTNAQIIGTDSLFTQIMNAYGSTLITASNAINKGIYIYNSQADIIGNAAGDNYIVVSLYYVVATMV